MPNKKSAGGDEHDQELRFHVDQLTEANMARGMAPEEARRQALLEFGGQEQITQELRAVHSVAIIEALRRQSRAAMRFVRHYPAFSVVVVLTIALAVGANTAVFSAINAVLLRPLPLPHSEQLVSLQQYKNDAKDSQGFVAPARLEDWNRLNSTFQAIAGYYTESASETSGELPERIDQAFVTSRFLQVWGVAPALGRNFVHEEETFHGPSAVLISDRLWRRKFNASADVIGKQLHFGRQAATIVGVMPASFAFQDRDVDAWTPVPADSPYSQNNRTNGWYITAGRLKPGVSIQQARADLGVVQQTLAKQYPATDGNIGVRIESLKTVVIGDSAGSLWLLYGSVTLLLLLACTNIATLLLARTAERQHEIAIRFSLGASRSSVIAQLLSEAFALALAGSVLGLCVAYAAMGAIRAAAGELPRGNEISLDWHILLYTLICSTVCTLLCGLIPALRGTRGDLARSLASAGYRQVATRSTLQHALVSTQVALAVTLLVVAGLLLRSFAELSRVSAGFDIQHVLTFHVTGSYAETADIPRLTQRIERTLDTLRGMPGVQGAATAVFLPGVPGLQPTEFNIVEGPSDATNKLFADVRYVSEGYFGAMGIPVLVGSTCQRGAATQQVVVNRSFANTYLGGGSNMQDHLHWGTNGIFMNAQIVGMAGDAREDGLETAPTPTIYACVAAAEPSPYFLVRTSSDDPMTMAESVRRVIHSIEPGRSVYGVATLSEELEKTRSEKTLRAMLLTLFAASAMFLACVGLYGSLAYFARLRRREIGLRLAIGASRGQIARGFLALGIRTAAVGCAVGLLLGVLASRLIRGMLFGVSSVDLRTYAGVVALVATLTLMASMLPAIDSARTDPMSALRED